jgi:hypothetical protein
VAERGEETLESEDAVRLDGARLEGATDGVVDTLDGAVLVALEGKTWPLDVLSEEGGRAEDSDDAEGVAEGVTEGVAEGVTDGARLGDTELTD